MSTWEEALGKSDEWYTPEYVFDALACRFDVDVAAPKVRTYCCVPAAEFITENSLDVEWNGFAWMNPPFGRRNTISKWLDKIYQHGNGIALTPDRTSAEWWHRAALKSDAMLFVCGKIKFVKPDGTIGKQPGSGTTLMAYGTEAVVALENAERNGLGLLTTIKL
jgi:hypothetical protein